MAATNSSTINVLFSTFEGLGLPSTLCIPTEPSATVGELLDDLNSRLPAPSDPTSLPLSVTTTCRKILVRDSQETILSLLKSTHVKSDGSPMINVRLSAPIVGGKGGFGSQLRAAGGRMSSRKNRRNPEQQNASNRNLDGRRLRTITEAKNLAAYLAMKPEMDKKEREEKRKRWEAVVEAAERKEDEIRQAKGGNIRLDGQWVEQKEDAESKTRDAVLAAMKAGLIGNEAAITDRTGSESSASGEEGDSDDAMEGDASSSSTSSKADDAEIATASKPRPAPVASAPRTFFGWDEDEEDMSDEEDEDEDDDEPVQVAYEGKGKGKA